MASAEARTETPVIRNRWAPKEGPLMDHDWLEGIECPFDIVRVFGRHKGDAPCFGHRPRLASGNLSPEYVWQTREQVWSDVRKLAWALEHVLGLKAGQRVSFFSYTRAEIHVLAFACALLRVQVVPIYESLVGPSAIAHIVSHSGACLAFITPSKAQVLQAALETLPADSAARSLKAVSFDEPIPGVTENTYSSLIAQAPALPPPSSDEFWARPEGAAKADDIAFLMYTSGTTGQPKGVLISHRSLVLFTLCIVKKVPPSIQYHGPDKFHSIVGETVHLSFLPLAHIFGLGIDYCFLRLDGCLGFYSGTTQGIPEDMKALHPTAITSVPRLFQRVYDATMSALAKKPWYLRTLFNAAWGWKNWWSYYNYQTPLVDKIVFGEIRKQLGGNMVLAIAGGAAISKDVVDFWRICCLPCFWVGYGMTETAARGIATELETTTQVFDNSLSPYINTEAKLVSVPSMSYLATDNPPRGELCLKGPSISLGYLNDPIKTAEVIDKDGWVHTGDIAVLVNGDSFRIIDRVKDLFKLSQGEYVSGELIESVLCRSPAIAQAFVHGEPDKNFPVAIVTTNPDWLLKFARENGLKSTDIPTLCQEKKVVDAVLEDAIRVSREGKLKGYELIKAVYIYPGTFDIENDMVTPSLKLKRHVLRTIFARQIDEMYSSL